MKPKIILILLFAFSISINNCFCGNENYNTIVKNNADDDIIVIDSLLSIPKTTFSIRTTNFTQYRILLDESHQPRLASDDSAYYFPGFQLSYAVRDCQILGHSVSKLYTEDLTSEILNNCDLLVIPLSYGFYTQDEMDCLYNWVKYQGGNLLLFVQDDVDGNLLDISDYFGYTISDERLSDSDDDIGFGGIVFEDENYKFENITYNINQLELVDCYTIKSKPTSALSVIITDTDGTAHCPYDTPALGEPVVAVERFTTGNEGRLAVFTGIEFLNCKYDSSPDGVINYNERDNSKLWKNSITWLLNADGQLSIDNDNDNLSDYTEVFTYHSSTESNDTDLDGLYDNTEAMIGSSLLTNDTDADGLSDFDEYIVYHTNPSRIDTDSDGLTDKEEVEITGTDPNKEDTDDDNIPDKAEIELSLDPFNATDATLDYDNDGLPNIEEYQRRTDLRSNDTDGDKINDYTEVYDYLTNPISNDTDRDNLTDYDELFIYHTNPKLRDTDQDGYWDGEEINSGTDPLDPNDFPPPPFTPPENQNKAPSTLLIGRSLFISSSITLMILSLYSILKRKIKEK